MHQTTPLFASVKKRRQVSGVFDASVWPKFEVQVPSAEIDQKWVDELDARMAAIRNGETTTGHVPPRLASNVLVHLVSVRASLPLEDVAKLHQGRCGMFSAS